MSNSTERGGRLHMPESEVSAGEGTLKMVLDWVSSEWRAGHSCTVVLPQATAFSALLVHGAATTIFDYADKQVKVTTEG